MADEEQRASERLGHDDPAEQFQADQRRRRTQPSPDPPPGDPDNPIDTRGSAMNTPVLQAPTPVPQAPTIGARPRKNPMWVRSVMKAGMGTHDLADDYNGPRGHGLVHGQVEPGMAMFVYGMSVIPIVTEENSEDVRALWEHGEFMLDMPHTNLLRMPMMLVMPNPLFLPFHGYGMDLLRRALAAEDKDLTRKYLRQALFMDPVRDLAVSDRPIQLDSHSHIRCVVYAGGKAPKHDVEFLLIFYGIMVRGITS